MWCINRWRHVFTILILVLAGRSGAQTVPTPTQSVPTISYQAMITGKDGKPLSGEHTVKITIYADPAGTQPIWSSSSSSMLSDGGILNVSLGSANDPLPSSAAMDRPLWVGVSVDGTRELRPFSTFSATPLALNVADRSVTSTKLADGSVTADKIGTDYVSSVTVEGMRVTPKGGALNLSAGEGLQLSYNEESNQVRIGIPRTQTANGTGSTTTTNGCSSNSDGTVGTNQVSGGCQNTIAGGGGHQPIDFSIIGGGQMNTITNVVDISSPRVNGIDEGTNWNVIAGGLNDSIVTDVHHSAPEQHNFGAMAIVGGQHNLLCGPWGFIGGGRGNMISSHIPVWDDDLADSLMWDVICGGDSNTITQVAGRSVIAGGALNTISGVASWDVNGVGSPVSSAFYSAIGGGLKNVVTSDSAVIAGGTTNVVAAPGATISGGGSNTIISTGLEAAIAGGVGNSTNAPYAFIGAGFYNQANQEVATTIGGAWLKTSGQGQTVLGWLNLPSGNSHFLGTGPNDDRIFEIGSPIRSGNLFQAANAFEVSYNGHSIVYHTNGQSLPGTPKVYQGATYVESPVYAWGAIDGTGNVIGGSSFGITQPAYLGLGTYMITLVAADPHGGAAPSLADASVTVTVLNDDVSDILTAPPIPPGESGGIAVASVASDSRTVPDSIVSAHFGGSRVADISEVAATTNVASPMLPNVCGYATASEIGVLVPTYGSAYARSFIVRTYSSGGEQCQKSNLSFFFKVCHR